ncbi:MAG: DMT family transporter [Roseiarcus sp.]
MNALLFAFVVVAWGLTWYGIKLELGPTPAETSIFWRFLIAAAMMWLGLAATRKLRRATLGAHRWFAALGLLLFSANFLCFYNAERFAPSGVVAVVFSVASGFNVVNQWIWRGVTPSPRVVAGAALGALGVAGLFADQLAASTARSGAPWGVGLALAGTYCFSLGNLASAPATRAAGDLPNAIARAMTWGTLYLAILVAARGLPFTPTWSAAYLGGLLYLSSVGSVAGFLAYLALVERIGPERAAYTTALSPVIALALSSALEGYAFSRWALIGAPLILIGNVAMFTPGPGRRER